MSFAMRLARGIDRLSNAVGHAAIYLVLLTVAIGFYNVVARYVGFFVGIQLSSNVFIEMQWYLFSLVFFLGFAYIMQHGINVRVDFLYGKWSLRQRARLDFWLNWVMLIPFCVIGVWVSWNPLMASWGRSATGVWCFAGAETPSWLHILTYVLDAFDLAGRYCGEVSPDPDGLNRAPIKSFILVAFVLLLLQAGAEQIKLWRILRQGDEDAARPAALAAEAPLRLE